jgi:gamma-glutamylcyclotransferase (GGCT)/AIG2-like uncharacterized protein YtfP
MTLYFAYGSNMSRALMRRLCPHARPLGIAVLDDHRFIITIDGYASVVAHPRARVHGILWRVGPREITALNAYESIDTGLYRRRILAVRHAGERTSALVYVGRSGRHGQPKPGYMELVLAAARDWTLPAAYVATLARWGCADGATTSAAEAGEIA